MSDNKKRSLYSRLSIKSQAIAITIAGISVMVILLSIFTSFVVNKQSRNLLLNNAFQLTEGLAKQAVFPLLSGAKENAEAAINHVLGFETVLSARLRTEKDKIFIDKSKSEQFAPVVPYKPNKTQITYENDNAWLVSTPVIVDSAMESEFDFSDNSPSKDTIGYAEVLISKKNLSQAQSNITYIIFLVGFISSVLLSVILYAGLIRLFQPLNALESTMETSAETGEHIFANVEGAKEIQNMAISYNSMMHVLDKQEESITKHRDQLEKEVYLRTQELVQTRDAALAANHHKSEFMANMSHELRTPIQSIIGYGELITEELEVEGHFELIDDMDKISNNAQRLLTMINSLLDLAKIEAGKLELDIATVNVAALVQSLEEVITPLANKNHNQFVIQSHLNISEFQTDKIKLEQILINLLSNACKFTEQGTVSLNISHVNNALEFVVNDTGIGLTNEQQAYIFDEFRQVDSGQARKFSGTGLGLAISLKLAKLLGGQINVKSELNQGASFTLKLPLSS